MFLGKNEIKKTVQVCLGVFHSDVTFMVSSACVTRIPSESRKFNVNNYNITSSIKLV